MLTFFCADGTETNGKLCGVGKCYKTALFNDCECPDGCRNGKESLDIMATQWRVSHGLKKQALDDGNA